jgi:hypothetical protein
VGKRGVDILAAPASSNVVEGTLAEPGSTVFGKAQLNPIRRPFFAVGPGSRPNHLVPARPPSQCL